MKKIIVLLSALLVFFNACSDDKNVESKDGNLVVLKVGATPNPHARILENIKDDLYKEGIDLQIVEFSDYVLPNLSLDDGSIDANFHQHQPYLDKIIEDKKLDIVSIAKVHIEPLGVYSKKIKNLTDLRQNALIAIPNDPSNAGRALILLHNNGIITLKDASDLYATERDIVKNPKNIRIKPVEAALLPKILGDVDAAVINGNYALQAGLSMKDALALEDSRSPYANVLVVKSKDVNNPNILKLKNALLSNKTKKFIKETYKDEILSVF